MPGNPFRLEWPQADGIAGHAAAAALPAAAWALGLRACSSIYARLQAHSHEPFDTRVLHELDIMPDCAPADLLAIPSRGPLIVAANHPHGALDGLLLASLLRRVRPDLRILANHLLARIPELADLCFYADPFRDVSAGARSLAGLRAAHRWLLRGGALIVFPSGEVAHRLRADGSYADSPWHATTGRLAVATTADVIPAFIAGGNRRRFYAAGRVHPLLRTALLVRELFAKRGSRIQVRIGPALSAEAWSRFGRDGVAVTLRARESVEQLGAATGARRLPGAAEPM